MDKETIRQARQTNLPQFLLSRGEQLIRNGTRYRHKEHDSLVFTRNMFYWNSRGLKGNAIDFLMNFYGMDFKTAVFELTKTTGFGSVTCGLQIDFCFDNIKIAPDFKRTIAYLCKSRAIDYQLIIELINKKLIYQEYDTNNVIFPIKDENGGFVGIEYHGTLTDKRFKGISKNSKYGYGYNITFGKPKNALFFESAIDLLSFVSITRIEKRAYNNVLLVSMAGLKISIIENMLYRFNATTPPIPCVDNDEAGNTFIKNMALKYSQVKPLFPVGSFKDWNEYLKEIKNSGSAKK